MPASKIEDMEGVDFWSETGQNEEPIGIQLKHRARGSGRDILLELCKDWITGEENYFNGKESKGNADLYLFINNEMDMHYVDGKKIYALCSYAFEEAKKYFKNYPSKNSMKLTIDGTIIGEVRITRRKSNEDTKSKKVRKHAKHKLMLFLNPNASNYMRYEGREPESLMQ
jgi:hypothetical protein